MNEITPNSTIGILGSGQLGRMLAVAAGDNNEFEELTN
jgi:phosphoribosylaminoimidazole carboxylase (NCAIR synthetase)